MNPTEMIAVGRQILDPALLPHGFVFEIGDAGVGSGGAYASGSYLRGDRRLELHFRHSLGLVTYRLGDLMLSHEDYMRAVLQGRGRSAYPGFSEDPLDGFRHLRHDLETLAQDFVSGSGQGFRTAVAWVAAHARPTGLGALSAGGAA
jgi:hypothetical protein